MIKVNIFFDSPKWLRKIKNPKEYFKKKVIKFNKISNIKRKYEISLLLTNNKTIKKLNFKFRKKNLPTDVLSFPSGEKDYIGDIAISYEFVNKKANLTTFSYELDKLWIHGYLHLIGYDHKKNNDFKKMNKKEKILLKYFH